MRHIRKGQEPQSLTDWKAIASDTPNCHYRDLRKPEKPELHQALLQEQGFICCYCERRIDLLSSHIEHLKPQCDCTDAETVDFTNLLACCQGEGEISLKPEHCGQKRGNQALKITPLNPACVNAFAFTEDGQILANSTQVTHEAAMSVIEVLGLNIRKLQRMRESAIQQSLADFDSFTDAEKQKLIQFYESVNASGRHEEFCSAIAHVLKQNTMV